MAMIGSTYLDIIDVLKRSKSDDKIQIAKVVELLMQTNLMLKDAISVECNLGTRHRTSLRTTLPTGAWGQLYKGVPASKSGTAQVEDTTGFYEQLSSIDTRLLKLAGADEGALRLSEAQGHLEKISQEMQSAMIYANADLEPLKFTGLVPRFNSFSDGTGGQIVDGGGAGADNTSIWFLTWGSDATHTIYPSGSQAGVERDDKGEQRTTDDAGNVYYVKEEMFTQHNGMVVRDFRKVARVANIDISELAAGNVDIYALLRKAFWKINRHRLPGEKRAIYANADVLEAIDAAATPTSSTVQASGTTGSVVRLRREEQDGEEVMTYRGIPFRQVDAILNTEELVA